LNDAEESLKKLSRLILLMDNYIIISNLIFCPSAGIIQFIYSVEKIPTVKISRIPADSYSLEDQRLPKEFR
jgi:hypothetical protein